jgi:hypothetical protein
MGHVIAVRRNHTYPLTIQLEVMDCPVCGIVYGLPKEFADDLRRQGRPAHYYCPNGHDLGWSESDADRQRKRADRAEREAERARRRGDDWMEEAEKARRSTAAYKGHITRMKNRIANGVCPVLGCKRSGFAQVLSHIASKHPAWLHDHPEVKGS